MAISIENVATEVRKIIKGSGYRLEMFTEQGDQTLDDREARRFFLKPSNIMITIDEAEAILKLHKPDIVQLEQIDQLHQTLKNLARKYRLNFDFKSFGHSLQPKDYVHQAIKSMNDEDIAMNNMAEGMSPMSGSTRSSYQLVDDNVKLIVRHTKPVDEAVRGSRSRNIKALFIENGAGERFQYPHIHLAGARAMARHVSMGGIPYDSVGTHISTLSEDYKKLQRFIRYATSNNIVNEETTDIIEAVRDRYWGIRKELGRLKGVKGYAEYANAIQENKYDADDDKITEIRNLFTAKTFDESLEEVLPLISQILEYRLSKDEKRPVGDKLSGQEGIDLIRSKVENVQFNEPGEEAAEYSSSNIISFAKSPEGKRDEVAYKISEMAQLVNDELLTSFLAQISEQFKNDEFPGQEKLDIIMELLDKAREQGVFSKKDSADVDVSDDEFVQQDTQDMPDEFNPPEVENKQFENWIKSITDDDVLFEEVKISEDDFVDFNRALAFAKERMNKLPRMSDGAPLIRRVKGMCEEIANEYDVKSEDLYAVLSGEDIINEGEPVDEVDPNRPGYGLRSGMPKDEPDFPEIELIDNRPLPGEDGYKPYSVETEAAIEIAQMPEFSNNMTGASKEIEAAYGEDVLNHRDVQHVLQQVATEAIDRISHLAGVEPIAEMRSVVFHITGWSEEDIEDKLASLDGAAWDVDAGTITASGVHPKTLKVLYGYAEDQRSGVTIGDDEALPRNAARRMEGDEDYSDPDRIESLEDYVENSYQQAHAMDVVELMKEKFGSESLENSNEYPALRDAAIKEFLDNNNVKYNDKNFENSIGEMKSHIDDAVGIAYQTEPDVDENLGRIKHLAGV